MYTTLFLILEIAILLLMILNYFIIKDVIYFTSFLNLYIYVILYL